MRLLRLENVTLCYRGGYNIFSASKKVVIQNLSIDIDRGENIGILGRNGAGKSTLLKLLAGIFQPESGRVITERQFRAAFIGLQGGFVPHMSGMENIVLTGMLTGMSRREIKRKLDSIIEYSELGAVINRPVFTYSAGMRARLAFSVSVFSEPDLLLIDEAMSVGDKDFRDKSKRTISELIGGEAAVVLVSHEAELISSLCSQAIWFENGTVRSQGECKAVVADYTASFEKAKNEVKSSAQLTEVVSG